MATEEQKIVDNINNLNKQYENLDLAIQYMLQNQRLPQGATPEQEFLNQTTTANIDAEIQKYEEQKQQIENIRKQFEEQLKQLKVFEPTDVKYEELKGQEQEQVRKETEKLKSLMRLYRGRIEEREKYGLETGREKERLKDITLKLGRTQKLPTPAGAGLKIKETYKGIPFKIKAQYLKTRLQELQQRNPDKRRDVLMAEALRDYEDQFPKAIEPSGREALLQEPANLSIDWQTSTLIDPKTNLKRKMTTEERDKFKYQRQVVYTPPRAKTKLLQHAKAQSYFNTMSTALSKRLQEQTKAMERLGISTDRGLGLLGTNLLKTIRTGDVRNVIGLTEKNQPTPEEMQQYPELKRLNEQTNAALEEYQRAKAQKDAIDPRNEGSLAKSGAVIESEFARGMRVATGLASLATIQGLRSLSKKTDDPNKPAEDFEVFELGKAAPTILLPPEEGGLSNPEARAAAIATMPMFMEFNKYYPKQQSTPAWIYGTGALAFATDIFMPVGPDAALIAATPFTGGTSLVGMGATKSGKLGAALAKGTAKTLKYTPKPKTAELLKAGMEILEVADEVFETTATLGMNKINRQALKAASGAVALRQANIMLKEAKTGKELSYKNVFEEPQTIRDMAAREVASPIGDSIDLQIKLRNAKSIAEVEDIQKRLVPDSIPDRVANKIIQTENLNAKYVDGLFNDELKTATKDVTDDAIRVGMYLGQKIPRMVSDASVLQISNNVYEQAFKNNVFLRSILGDSFQPNPDKLAYIRNELLKAEKVGSGAVDNFVDDIVLREARARPDIISKAAEDVIADMVSERLFSRAPNNSVFFSRSLLIDKRIASNPEFQNKVRTALKAYPVNVNAKGDIVFNNGANVLNNLIVELGPTPFRRSPKWKSIAKGLMDDKGFNVRDYSLITDSLKAREAKRIIKQDYPQSRAQTARYLSPEAYKYASEPFIRSGQTFGAKINAVSKRVNEALPKKMQSKRLKAGDVEAVPFQRLENNLREMTGSEFNNLVKELQSYDKGTARNVVFGEVLNKTQKQYVNQATKEIRALWDGLRPYEVYMGKFKALEKSRVKPFMEKHPLLRNKDVILKLEKKADDAAITFDDIIAAVDIDKSFKTQFIEDFLNDFFKGVDKPPKHDEYVKAIAKDLSDKELSIEVFDTAIAELRKNSKNYQQGGLAKFKPFQARWQDAVEELLLFKVVKKRASTKFNNELKELFEENPWIKTDIIQNPQSSVRNEVKWEASQAGTNISNAMKTVIRSDTGDISDVRNELLQTEDGEIKNRSMKAFVDGTTEAFKDLEMLYANPQTMAQLGEDLFKEVVSGGYKGLQEAIEKEIKEGPKSFQNRINKSLDSLRTAVENSIIKVERKKIEKQLGIDTIPGPERRVMQKEFKKLFKPIKDKNKETRKQIKKLIDEAIAKEKLKEMEKIGINPTLSADARKRGMKQVQAKMKVLTDENKAYRKTEAIEQNRVYSQRRKELDLKYELDTLSREERQRRIAARKQKETAWQAEELTKLDERLTAKSNELKEKLGLPSRPKAMTEEAKAEAQKELRQIERKYNKETFLAKDDKRRQELVRIMEDSFGVKATDELEREITNAITAEANAIEELHRGQRVDQTAILKETYPDEKEFRRRLYRYNLHKFIEKWDQIDNIIINKYISAYFKEAKTADDVFLLQDRIRTEISDWDAKWKADRAYNRIGVMNEARIELGLSPLLDKKSYASKMKEYKAELKTFRKAERKAYDEARKKQRVVFNEEVGIRERLDPKLKKERTLLRNEELKELRKQHLAVRQATRAAQKKQKDIKRLEFYNDAGIPKPQKGVELKAKREQLANVMEGVEEKYKASKERAYKKLDEKQKKQRERTRLKVGLRPEKTAEEWFIARKELNRRLEEVDVSRGEKIRENIDSQIKMAKENSNVLHPVKRLGDDIINNLQARGVDVFARGGTEQVLDAMQPTLKSFNKNNVQAMFGKDFAKTWDKATKNLENGTFAKSFETLQGRNKKDVDKAIWWTAQSFDFFRQQAVGGLLGGYGTLRYATLNALSAPFMMAMTRGIAGTAEDLGMGLYNLSRRLEPNDVMFTDVNGLSWTKKQIDDLERRYPLAASEAGAELDNSNLRYLMDIVNRKEGGFAKLVHGATPLAARNYVARFGDFTDSYFRKLVFRNGIKRGLTPAAAAREAKDALFDYSKARDSEFERRVGQVIYFWSFQRESFRSVIDAIASGKASQLLHSYRAMNHLFHDEELKATGSNFDAARLYRYLTTDFEGKKGIAAGFAIPAFESIGVMAEGLSLALYPLQQDILDVSAVGEAGKKSLNRLVKNFTERKPFRPSINIILELIDQTKDEATRKGFYVPNYVVSGMPDWAWPTFKESFDIVPVPINERRENKASRVDEEGNPQHWRFKNKTAQGNYEIMQAILLGLGIKRTIDDNILKSGAILKQSEPGKDEPYPYSSAGSLLDLLMFQAATKTYLQSTPPRAEIERTQKRKQRGIQSQSTK